MQKPIETHQFTQTLPITFSHRQKRPYTLNHQVSQISDFAIIQRLQLFLISLRQQSLKQKKQFLHTKQKLQQQVNYQNKVITILEEQNRLLRVHVELYVQKCGGLTKCPIVKSSRGGESLVQIQVQQEEQQQNQEKEQERKNDSFHPKIAYEKSNNLRKTSSNHKQNNKNLYNDQELQSSNKSPPSIHLNKSAQDCQQLNGSSSSNFYKKKVPFNHRRQSSLQKQEYNRINIMPIMSRYQQQNNLSQVSEISCVESRKDTFGDKLMDERKTYKDKEKQQQQQINNYQQVDFLNLQSDVSELFNQKETYRYHEEEREQQDLLLEKYNNKQDGQCQQSLVCNFESIEESSREDQRSFNSAETDSDIRRMEDALEAQFGTQSKQLQKNQDKHPKIILRHQDHEQLDHPSLKTLEIFHKGNQQINDSFNKIHHQISSEKRLRDLFSPLRENILSKKINLPITIKNVPIKQQQFIKKSSNSSEMFQNLKQFDRNNILARENRNPLQVAVKRLKEGKKFFGIR